MRLGELHRLLDDLDALALQNIRERRVVLEVYVIELGDQLGFVAVPIVEQRRDDAARLQQLVKADPVEQLQRRGMIGAGARHLFKEIVVVERLDQRDLDARLRERERRGRARPAPPR